MNSRSITILIISLLFSQSCVTPKSQKSEKIHFKEKNKDKPTLLKQDSKTRDLNSLDLIEKDKEIELDTSLSENDILSDTYNDKVDQVYIYQNGEEQLLKNEVSISKSKFSIRFYNYEYNDKFRYNARLKVTEHKRDLRKIKIGAITNDSSNTPFSEGWGIAANKIGGYTRLFFIENGFHYLYYSSEIDRRVKLIKKGDNLLKLDFEINNYSIGREGLLNVIEEIPIDKFYLAIYIDKNLNYIVDKGELIKCKVVFR